MRPELVEADRRREVTRAAAAWRAAGAIDDAALAAIRTRYPDDRRRARAGFRILFFVFTLLGVQAAFAFWIALFGGGLFGGSDRALGVWLALFAVASALAAETATGRLKMRGFGIEEALAVHTVGFGTAGVALLLGSSWSGDARFALVCCALAGLAAFAAWRWGTAASGVAAALGLFGALFETPAPRFAWIAAGALVAIVAGRAARAPDTAPAHRARWTELRVVAVAALYAATHVWSLEPRWTGGVRALVAWAIGLPSGSRVAAWLVMTALPLLLIRAGVRRRDRVALALGALLAIATAATAVAELGWGEPWLRLVTGGAALAGVALALRRRFARRTDRTVAGFTDRQLFGGSAALLEAAAAVAVFTPAAATPEPKVFRGEGGEFGGGGASGTF